jgi:RNA polymerase sigma factor, sigma-70 family
MEFEDGNARGVRALAAGDPLPPDDWPGPRSGAALDAAYAAHGPRLARYFRRHLLAQDVGDFVQECFRRFAQVRASAPDPIDRPAAYLVRTAHNLVAERARADGRRMQAGHVRFDEDVHAGPDPHEALEARDTIRRLEDTIARLKPKTRTIFLMHRIEGLSYEEIAVAQGMSVKGVEKQMTKALGAIRRSRQDGR